MGDAWMGNAENGGEWRCIAMLGRPGEMMRVLTCRCAVRSGMLLQLLAWQGKAGKAVLVRTRCGLARSRLAWQRRQGRLGRAWQFSGWLGYAHQRRGRARQAWRGLVLLVKAMRVESCRDLSGLGMAMQAWKGTVGTGRSAHGTGRSELLGKVRRAGQGVWGQGSVTGWLGSARQARHCLSLEGDARTGEAWIGKDGRGMALRSSV